MIATCDSGHRAPGLRHEGRRRSRQRHDEDQSGRHNLAHVLNFTVDAVRLKNPRREIDSLNKQRRATEASV